MAAWRHGGDGGDGGVAAWRRGGVAAWRRGGVAAWRRGGVAAWRRGDLNTAEEHFKAMLAIASEQRLIGWMAEAESSLARVHSFPRPRLGQGKSLPDIASEVDLISATLGS